MQELGWRLLQWSVSPLYLCGDSHFFLSIPLLLRHQKLRHEPVYPPPIFNILYNGAVFMME